MPPFQKGQSGNPKGRPPKQRALTTILEKAGAHKVERDGKMKSRKDVLAEMLWQAAMTGRVVFPLGDGVKAKDAVVKLAGDDWFDVVKFIYTHVDGPAKTEVDMTSGGKPVEVIFNHVPPRDAPHPEDES